MNLFYITLLFSFCFLLLLRDKQKALNLSFLLLTIPWCFQYQMTQDWDVNLLRWDFVNVNAKVGLDGEDRQLEPLYTWILQRCKPLTFYGFLILSGLFELFVIYIFLNKYVPPKLYWVSIFILMIKVNYGLLIINSNRQSIAIMMMMLGVYFMLKCNIPRKIKDINTIYILLFVSFFYAAPFIHGSAYISFALIPLYLLICFIKNPNRGILILIFNLLYISRFLIDAGNYQFFASVYLNSLEVEGMDFFDKYLEGLDNESLVSSRFNQTIEWLMMNLLIIFYNKFSRPERLFAMSWIVSYILGGFLINTLARITIYFYIFLLFVAPRAFELLTEKIGSKNVILISIYTITLIFYTTNFIDNMLDNGEGRYYYRWNDFKTLFEAPEWH